MISFLKISQNILAHTIPPDGKVQWKLYMDLVEWRRKLGEIPECQHFIENREVMPDKMLKACKTGLDKGNGIFVCDFCLRVL